MNLLVTSISLIGIGIALFTGNSRGQSTTDVNPKAVDSSKPYEYADYTEFKRVRFEDKVGFSQPVEAFSILIPDDWTADGGVLWNPPGSVCAGTNLGLKAQSPDGKFTFEMMPNFIWSFISDPQVGQFQQQQNFPKYCGYGQPMNADDYFRQVFALNELGNPQILSMDENNSGQRSLEESGQKIRTELMKYGASQVNLYPSGITASVKWGDGKEAIVLCGVTVIETVIPNPYTGSFSKAYTSSATERVVLVFPEGEKEKATKMLSVMMTSFRTNTFWKSSIDSFWKSVREQSNQDHIGKIRLLDQQTAEIGRNAIRQGQQNLANMDAQMRSWEASQASQDLVHTSFVKAIREVENYRDETGTFELSSGYGHTWSRGDGSNFIMTDNPNFDPSSVFQDQRWKEMKKVD